MFDILCAVLLAAGPAADKSPTRTKPDGGAGNSAWSYPPDIRSRVRAVIAEDHRSFGPLLPAPFLVVDTVIDNTDPMLAILDTAGDSETSIAVNPLNPDEIVISAFSGGWSGVGTTAPIFHSINGGVTWSKVEAVPQPIDAADFCPCDWTFDYDRQGRLSGTILAGIGGGINVITGTTTNPTDPTSWNWRIIAGSTQLTNGNVPTSIGNADQPWLLTNSDPVAVTEDNIYVAYDDFFGAPDMREAVSVGIDPPDFARDNESGLSTGAINPGQRLAKDPRTGAVYSLFQRCVSNCGSIFDDPKTIDYMLNRSTDGGLSWSLNSTPGGIVVGTGVSTQPNPKFGDVNALLGGILHATVDPVRGDVYYVYGSKDTGTGNDRLAIRRLTDDGVGGLTVGPEFFVTGQVEAALPSVAVLTSGTVGVFYYTFDGIVAGFPQFTAHFAESLDQGRTFTDNTLLTFLSAETDNGDSRQRVLGDYHQVKSLGVCFYGAFTANGAAFGRPVANHDPIFFKACEATCPLSRVDATLKPTTPPLPAVYTNVCSATDTRIDDTITVLADIGPGPLDTGDSADPSLSASLRFYQTDCGCVRNIYVTKGTTPPRTLFVTSF